MVTVGTYCRVELYNLWEPFCKHPKNGWLVAKYTADGRRMNTVRRFGTNESAARSYAELWNGPDRPIE